MDTTVSVPSLSGKGWIDALEEKADLLFTHFYTSDYLQTSLYPDQVTNMQWLIEKHGHDPITLCLKLRDTLERYLGRYYSSASVNVSSDADTLENQTEQVNVKAYITVLEGGNTYSFGALIKTVNSKFVEVIRLNNNG